MTNNTDVAASQETPERDEMPEPRDARAMMPYIFGQANEPTLLRPSDRLKSHT